MALHRDVYWVGRQWAVTGYGIQACDQRQKSQFDIEASRLWEDGVLEGMRALAWLNIEDFEKALSVARQHYPEPPRKAVPAEENASGLRIAVQLSCRNRRRKNSTCALKAGRQDSCGRGAFASSASGIGDREQIAGI